MRQRACPVALHPDGVPLRLAAFDHPQAGLQLVTGDINQGEGPATAAARALFEGSRLETTSAIPIGQSDAIYTGEIWHFTLCRLKPPVRDRWQHFCPDDGGHLLKFWWLPLKDTPPAGFDPRYLCALDWIKATL